MCDTRFRESSFSGEKIDKFLQRALGPHKEFEGPALSVPTLERLTGHIADYGWLTEEVADMLQRAQSDNQGNRPIDRFIAPALRTVDDFRDFSAVIIRVAGIGMSDELFSRYDNALIDEEAGRIKIAINDHTTVAIDPRSPTLWPVDDYNLVARRPKTGSGHIDQIARRATASIRLSEFVTRPRVDQRFIQSALRHFKLTGK